MKAIPAPLHGWPTAFPQMLNDYLFSHAESSQHLTINQFLIKIKFDVPLGGNLSSFASDLKESKLIAIRLMSSLLA